MRIIEFDILKGFAIFAVIYTHCMQYLFDSSFENPVYNFIYCFHMPLFIVISGILSFRKIFDRGKQSLPIKRFPLLIPAFMFGGMLIGLRLIMGKSIGLTDIISLPFTFWFLSALFFCTCAYWAASLICKKQIINLLALSIISLLLPIGEYNKFMIPLFGIGMCFAQYDIISYLRNIRISWICLSVIITCTAYVIFWDSDYTIYKTTCPSISVHENKQIIAYLLRIIFGLCFTIVLFAISFRLKFKNSNISVLSYLSRHSLELYVLHLFILIIIYGSGITFQNITDSTICIVTLSFIIAVLFTAFLSLFLKLISKIKIINFILFGRRNS